MITANEAARDQRLAAGRYQSYQSPRSSEPVKKSRKHRKSRTGSDGTHVTESRSPKTGNKTPRKESSSGRARELQRETSTSTSQSSRQGQLVDLVVENREAEERERAQSQRAFGSAWTGPERKHFQ